MQREALIRATVTWLTIKWGSVTPCAGRTWDECLTVINGRRALWFRAPDHSTRIHWC